MARAKDEAMWVHTSTICATVANLMRDPKRPPIRPDDINPYAAKQKSAELKRKLEDFKRRNNHGRPR